MTHIPIITIDGPSGAGKGTLAIRLANRLGWHFLDSGALYRVFAVAMEKQQVARNNEQLLGELAKQLQVDYQVVADKVIILLAGEDVSQLIREERISKIASKLATIAEVREGLLACQRGFCKLPGLVADGRDLGTVVFPQADIKIFLTANVAERAKRRFQQLKAEGFGVRLSTLQGEMQQRDERDAKREVAPLCPAPDAIIIDSSNLTADEVFSKVWSTVTQRLSVAD